MGTLSASGTAAFFASDAAWLASATFAGACVSLFVGGASKRLPGFVVLNPESILFAGSFAISSSVFLFTEGADVFFAGVGQGEAGFAEDPTDPLFPPPQPASSFERGTKTAKATTSVISIFFISITV